MQHAMQKNEGGYSHIRGAMNEHALAFESLHHPAEGLEILRGGRFEIHGDVDVRHTQTGDDASFVWQRIIGGWQCEVDNDLKAGLLNGLELARGWLAGGAEPFTDGAEAVDLGQG